MLFVINGERHYMGENPAWVKSGMGVDKFAKRNGKLVIETREKPLDFFVGYGGRWLISYREKIDGWGWRAEYQTIC